MHLAAALVLAVSIQFTQAALQAPLPDFKSRQELQATARKANGTVPSETEAFYTGKPFEANREGYLFKYRSYNPAINRWVSADPTGFPDGVNNAIYLSSPICAFDPDGAEKEVTVSANPSIATSSGVAFLASVSQPVKGDIYGALQTSWGSTASTNGWIVQKIHYEWWITRDSDGSEWNPPELSGAAAEPTTFWEAWRVTVDANGSVSIKGDENGGGDNEDNYRTPNFYDTTTGYFNILGAYGFYTDTQVSGNSPISWGSGLGPAGDLHSTDSQPNWWGSVSGYHDLYLSWE